jgi:hypothetical protein
VTRVSKIRRLPPELREQLHSMLDAGHTLDEITAHLKKMGADVSRSGLGRYRQGEEKIAASIRESRAAAEAIVSKLGVGTDEGTMGRALTQIVQSLAFRHAERRQLEALEGGEDIELAEIYQLARIVRQAGLAGRAGQDHELKTREVVREEAAETGDGPATTGWEDE